MDTSKEGTKSKKASVGGAKDPPPAAAAEPPPSSGAESEPPTTSEAVTGDTTTEPTTSGAKTLADLLGSDPNAPTSTDGEKKGKKGKGKKGKKGSKKGKKGKKKGKKGKKGKKKKGKDSEPTTTVTDTGPKYTQQDIDDYIARKEKERRRRREDNLVEKMRQLITLVPADDIRWTTYTLAPLHQFIRKPDVEVVTCFFHFEEAKKEEKKLLFADSGLDDEDNTSDPLYDQTKENAERDSIGQTEEATTRGSTTSLVDPDDIKERARSKNQKRKSMETSNSKGWRKMSSSKGKDGKSLIVLNTVVPNRSPDLFYFVKLRPILLDKDNFFENVLFGNIPGGQVSSLHSLLSYVYGPMFRMPGVLPESKLQNQLCLKIK